VSLQISLLSKFGAANYANKQALIDMNALMTGDATFAAETFVTDIADIRLSTRVPDRMLVQFLFSSETAVAQNATIWQDL